MTYIYVALIGEDELCLSVLKKLTSTFNPNLCVRYDLVARGFANIKKSIPKYIEASLTMPHIILTDLDRHSCPLSLMDDWKVPTDKKEQLIFRIAIKEVEAWLLADRSGFANFLGLNTQRVPPYPETIPDPKRALLQLAAKSRKAGLARDLIPEKNSSALIGPFYNERLSGFIGHDWNPNLAAESSESLRRAIAHIKKIGNENN